MKKSLVATGAAIAVSALVTLGTVSPASADVTVVSPIAVADTGTRDHAGYGAAVSNDGALAAAAQEYGGVTIYNVAAGTQIDVSMATLSATDLGTITFSPDGALLYVAAYSPGAIVVLNTSDGSVNSTISLPFSPWTLEASRDGAFLYVSDYSGGYYYQVDLSNDSLGNSVSSSSSAYPNSMCLSADGSKLYAPNYSDSIDVITTSDMTKTTWAITGASELFSCEWDNDGNLIVGDYGNSVVLKLAVADGSILDTSADLYTSQRTYVYQAVPSCDKVYVSDYETSGQIPVLDLSTFTEDTTIFPTESPSGSWYGVNGDRSLDGSVVALSGYTAADGLVIIKSPECGSSTPELPNTGVDSAATSISLAVAGGMLIAGAIALVAIRRRNA